MSRYFKLSEKPSEGNGKSGAEFEEDARDSALHQVSTHVAAGGAGLRGYEPAVEFARGHEADARANPACGFAGMASHLLVIERFMEKAAERAGGNGTADAVFAVTRPEVASVLGEILGAAGGEEIVKRLKEYDEKIAAAECTSPAIGRLVGAYYVPFLREHSRFERRGVRRRVSRRRRVGSEERGTLARARFWARGGMHALRAEILERHGVGGAPRKRRQPKPRAARRISLDAPGAAPPRGSQRVTNSRARSAAGNGLYFPL